MFHYGFNKFIIFIFIYNNNFFFYYLIYKILILIGVFFSHLYEMSKSHSNCLCQNNVKVPRIHFKKSIN